MNAVETYGGITWRRARDAVDVLIKAKLVESHEMRQQTALQNCVKPESIDDLIWLPNELCDRGRKRISADSAHSPDR